ncbi:two-component system, sensor histidine kinase [Patescibacteria group bacterium]|nr:two-component system, sensor histidine kinase [Patescibacteria group bacterium]
MQTLIDIKDFIPHGYCLTWNSTLLWLTVISDSVMTLAYATYPIGITYFVCKRKDLHYRWLYLGFFIAFILTCASTHLMSVITIWLPLYWLDAYVKAVSAFVATATVFAIWWVIPRALKLPSPEELKKALDAAETANKAKSVFLANMSHELRTPLNAILGFSSIMQKDAACPDSQKHYLEIINRSGEHLLTLINDVLEMAKIDAGRIQLEEKSFDLGGMVRDVADMMSVRATDKGLRLLIDQSSQFPRFIKGDEARLRQILINLIGNALKFTQQGGVTLRLGTRQNAVTHLMIEVEDTGTGIAPDDQKRIFEPFVQLGEQGDSKGTGLGLTITRQFVQLMGGQLVLESTLGKGSLFRIDLPLKEAEKKDIIKPKALKQEKVVGLVSGQPDYRVLIVEDQLENQLLLSQLMESVGIQIKIAKNGQQGIELFESWHPHLIWMDRRMPVMDGLEATKIIRQLPNGQDVKIVAVTASAFMEQREEMLQAGMDDFLRKPYRPDEIYDCLSKHLGVKYAYEDLSEDVLNTLTPEMFAKLPETLRNEFKDALESLETERIDLIIEEIANYDSELQKTLNNLANNFDYSTILKALN